MTILNTAVRGIKDSHFGKKTNMCWHVLGLGRVVVVLGHAD